MNSKIPFKTTHKQIMNLGLIMAQMRKVGIDSDFVMKISDLAKVDQGIYDLMALWLAAKNDPDERDQIMLDLKESYYEI